MSGPEVGAINDIAGKVGRLEASYEATTRALTELTASVNRLVEKLDRSDDIAREALQSVKSAHYRLKELGENLSEIGRHYDGEVRTLNTRIEIESKTLNSRIDNENEKRRQGQRWIVGTMLTAAGLIVAIIKLF